MKPQPQIPTKKLGCAYRDEQNEQRMTIYLTQFSEQRVATRWEVVGTNQKECQIDRKRHKKDILWHFITLWSPTSLRWHASNNMYTKIIPPSSFLQCVFSLVSFERTVIFTTFASPRGVEPVSQAGSMVLHGLRTSSPSWCPGMRGSMCEDRVISDWFRGLRKFSFWWNMSLIS